MTPTEIAQQILQGRWMHAAAARRACQQRAWPQFAREVGPKKPLAFGRGDYERCSSVVDQSFTGPNSVSVTIVPLWGCATMDETSTEWFAVHGVATDGERLEIRELSPFLDDAAPSADAVWVCEVQRWTAALIVKTEDYGASAPLRLRAGAFGVLDQVIDEVVAVHAVDSEPIPRPTREVPMFASWFAPRVTVSSELDAKIRALSFTAAETAP